MLQFGTQINFGSNKNAGESDDDDAAATAVKIKSTASLAIKLEENYLIVFIIVIEKRRSLKCSSKRTNNLMLFTYTNIML